MKMAKPIRPTPTLRGMDAKRFVENMIKEEKSPSPRRIAFLKECERMKFKVIYWCQDTWVLCLSVFLLILWILFFCRNVWSLLSCLGFFLRLVLWIYILQSFRLSRWLWSMWNQSSVYLFLFSDICHRRKVDLSLVRVVICREFLCL